MRHNYKWEECPDNKFDENCKSNESNAIERQKSRYWNTEREIAFEDDNSCNLIIEDESSYDDVSLLNISEPYDSESEDKEDEEETFLLWNRRPVIWKEKLVRKTRAGVMLFLEDKNGNTKNELWLLDKGSTDAIISKYLVENMDLNVKQ